MWLYLWTGASCRGKWEEGGGTEPSAHFSRQGAVDIQKPITFTAEGGRIFLKNKGFMQIRLFTIPIGDGGAAVQEMNAFLRGNKILEVEKQLIHNEHGAYWCFCVSYIERSAAEIAEKKAGKVDYRKVLDEATFQKFSRMREIRKKIATQEGISAFLVFTDEELAEMAKLEHVTEKAMLGIKGIGEKKVERYAQYFIHPPSEAHETAGLSD